MSAARKSTRSRPSAARRPRAARPAAAVVTPTVLMAEAVKARAFSHSKYSRFEIGRAHV